MQGIELTLDEESGVVTASIKVQELNGKLTGKALIQEVQRKYPEFDIEQQDDIETIIEKVSAAKPDEGSQAVEGIVAFRRDAKIEMSIADDEMSAKITFTAAYGGTTPTAAEIKQIAKKNKITKGVSDKAIEEILIKAKSLPKGAEIELEIAKGLPPRNGKPAQAKPLFENVQERILKPREKDKGKVDMRDLGDILSVKPGTPLLEFVPPTDGRAGYTVLGTVIPAEAGEWGNKDIGPGTEFSPDNDCLVIASEEGVPKFENGVVSVEDIYMSPGCNVSTGNIKYDGDVMINGDVTEQMMIEATGDVTVTGFVESAIIKAGGTITLVDGATGRMEEDLSHSTCQLLADGGVHIQRGRGLYIKTQGQVTITKELAFSHVVAAGDIVAGDGDVPAGTIYASKLVPMQKVRAGKLGAVSGSRLTIDFTASVYNLETKIGNLSTLDEKLSDNVQQLEEKLKLFADKKLSEQQQAAYQELKAIYATQKKTSARIKLELKRNEEVLDVFTKHIGVQTYSKLYPGVRIQFHRKTWETKDELSRANITYQDDKWHYEPLV